MTASAVAASSFIGGITGDVTGNLTGDVTGNLTGTATTATALTPTADVDIADLTVGIASVSEFIGVGTDFKTGSIAIGNSTTSSGNDIFINRAGTEVQNATVKLWSNLESTITIEPLKLSMVLMVKLDMEVEICHLIIVMKNL